MKSWEQRLLRKEARRKNMEMDASIKLNRGCLLCNYNKCADALHWHHLNPHDKEKKIMYRLKKEGSSVETYFREIKKCILVCANCHAEIHNGMHSEYIDESSTPEKNNSQISFLIK